jgi:hypothetical protein
MDQPTSQQFAKFNNVFDVPEIPEIEFKDPDIIAVIKYLQYLASETA